MISLLVPQGDRGRTPYGFVNKSVNSQFRSGPSSMMLFFRGLTCQTAVPDSEILSDAIRDFGRAVGCKGNQIFGKQKFSCIFCRPDRLAASPSFRPRRRRSRARRRRPDGPDLSSAPEHFLAAVATAPPPLLCSRAPRRRSRSPRRRPRARRCRPDLPAAPTTLTASP